MQKLEVLYSGKAKSLYSTEDPELLIMEFRNDTSAFDGVKKEKLTNKGAVNNQINAFIMSQLQAAGVPVHFVESLGATRSLVKNLQMIPLECVVRNLAAGSLCRRLGVTEGQVLEPPTYELFLKNDELHDPLVNESLALSFRWASAGQLKQMQALTFKVNSVLKSLFAEAGMTLVDYKLEFGMHHGEVVLGDEFSPDGCRIWDASTGEKMDKDRFRQDLGSVVEYYQEIGNRLGVVFV